MARFLRSSETGELMRIEISAEEMASKILDCEIEELIQWSHLIPASRGEGKDAIYSVKSKADLEILKKRAAVLKTQMNEKAVAAVEKAGLLDSYAALAQDCPEGLTAHAWRSYGTVVLMQVKFNVMIGPKELAERAKLLKQKGSKMVLDVEMAERHLRVLKALGYLREGDGRWEHQGLPEAWVGSES